MHNGIPRQCLAFCRYVLLFMKILRATSFLAVLQNLARKKSILYEIITLSPLLCLLELMDRNRYGTELDGWVIGEDAYPNLFQHDPPFVGMFASASGIQGIPDS